mgnify:CR=1 FL=1
MPRNKKEGFLFTTLMCFCMVLGMSVYNLLLHQQLSWGHFISGFIPGFIVAFLLDIFVVGAIVPRIVSKLNFVNKEKKVQMVLAISTLMILGMVSFMSMFGILIEGGVTDNLGLVYLQTWLLNFIVALPLQLLIVGPFSRSILSWVQSK